MLVFPLLLLVLIALGVVLLIRTGRSGGQRREGEHADGLATLAARYAKGEISREEYLKMKQDITS